MLHVMLSIRPLNFNSIKVQLKQTVDKDTVCLHSFQFHKGTIKTRLL